MTREEILTEARKGDNFFLMDYAGLEQSWTGRLLVTPINREAIKRALSAFHLYRQFPYPANYSETLNLADAALVGISQQELTVVVQHDSANEIVVESGIVRVT